MPHPLALTLTVAGSVSTLVAFLVAMRRVIRGGRAMWRQLLDLLNDIKTASEGFAALRQSLAELAGSMVRTLAALMQRQDELAKQVAHNSERLDALAEIITDLDADLARRRIRSEARPDDHDPPAAD